jgi:hypothetical protein
VYRLGAVDPGMSVIAAAVHPGFMLRAKSSLKMREWFKNLIPNGKTLPGLLTEYAVGLQERLSWLNPAPNTTVTTSSSNGATEDDSALDDLLGPGAEVDYAHRVSQELSQYHNSIVQYRGHSPLDFWRVHAKELPILADVAKSCLVIPASSGMVERAFSTSNWLARKRRSRLVHRNLRTLMILRHATHGKLTMDDDIVDDEESIDDSNGLPDDERLAAADTNPQSAGE